MDFDDDPVGGAISGLVQMLAQPKRRLTAAEHKEKFAAAQALVIKHAAPEELALLYREVKSLIHLMLNSNIELPVNVGAQFGIVLNAANVISEKIPEDERREYSRHPDDPVQQ